MSADFTNWLVRSLGLPLFEETPRGGVRANSPARERLGDVRPTSLADAIARSCGLAGADEDLSRAVERARGGDPQEITVAAQYRVAIAPIDKGRASAVIAPIEVGGIQTRAAAADLAAGVSHELANALGAIAGWASLARNGGNVDEALSVIETSAESAWASARHMLGRVSGRIEAGPTITDASALVQQVSRLIAPRAMQAGVQIERRISDGITVAGEHSDLWAVVWNLALNAIEAMTTGGTLLLQLTGTPERALLVVADTGPGMSAELQARIFDPYVSTKATGTGIGLATVKRAIGTMGGEVDVTSTVGRGSRFEVRLLRKAAAAKPTVVRRSRLDSDRSSGVFRAERITARVLVVDDDNGLREMTATALSVRGADVTAVGTAAEALAATGHFDLALIDMLLPDTTGDALLQALRAKGAVTKGLLVTGTDVAQVRLAKGGEPNGVLRKPFRLDDLFEHVTEALRDNSDKSTIVGA